MWQSEFVALKSMSDMNLFTLIAHTILHLTHSNIRILFCPGVNISEYFALLCMHFYVALQIWYFLHNIL